MLCCYLWHEFWWWHIHLLAYLGTLWLFVVLMIKTVFTGRALLLTVLLSEAVPRTVIVAVCSPCDQLTLRLEIIVPLYPPPPHPNPSPEKSPQFQAEGQCCLFSFLITWFTGFVTHSVWMMLMSFTFCGELMTSLHPRCWCLHVPCCICSHIWTWL